MPILEAKDVTMRFGGLTAVDKFNLTFGFQRTGRADRPQRRR